MEIRQLRYFLAISEEQSFSRAALRLRVAQSALSSRMRNLEAELGVLLFVRESRGVRVTEAGERFRAHVNEILAGLAQAVDAARGAAAEPEGEVRLGLPGPITEMVGVALIEAIARRYPRLRLRLVEAMSGYVLEWLRNGRVDLAILYVTPETMDLALAPLVRERLDLVVPTGERDRLLAGRDAVGIADLASVRLVLPGAPHGLRALVDRAARRARIDLVPAIEADSYPLIKALVARGRGCAILPRVAVLAEIAAGDLETVAISAPGLTRDVALAYAHSRAAPLAVTKVEQICREVVAELVESGRWPGVSLAPAARPSG